MTVKLLDCTLREGAHLNDGNFGRGSILDIISGLEAAGIEFIEIGFLRDSKESPESTIFNSLENVERLIDDCDVAQDAEFVLMLRPSRFDIEKLDEPKGVCNTVRIAFYKHRLQNAIEYAETIQSHGFDVFLNPIAISSYTNDEIERLVSAANDLEPRGVNIVDTFGALDRASALKMYDQFTGLDPAIKIGLHFHQNLDLAAGNCQNILASSEPDRDLTVDASLYGMGRSPGNLQIEAIANYLNDTTGSAYQLGPLFTTIDDKVKPLKEDYDWGYSPEYFVSAVHNVHRTYGEKLKADGRPLTEINAVCESISGTEAAWSFDRDAVDEYFDE